MEKRVVIAMILSVVVLMGWGKLFSRPAPPRPDPTVQPADPNGGNDPDDGAPAGDPAPQPGPDGGSDDPPAGDGQGNEGRPADLGVQVYEPVEDVTLVGQRADWVFTSRGASLREARTYGNPNGPAREDVPGDPGAGTAYSDETPGTLAVTLIGVDNPDLTDVPWGLSLGGGDRSPVVRGEMHSAGLRIVKTFRDGSVAEGESYHGVLEIEVTNPEGAAAPGELTLEVVGPWMPLGTRPAVDDMLLVARFSEDEPQQVDDPETFRPSSIGESLAENPRYELAGSGWAWIGMRREFFLSALIPLEALPAGTSIGFHARKTGSEILTDTAAPSFRIPLEVPTRGTSRVFKFNVYAGPNSHGILDRPEYGVLDGAVPTRMLSIPPIEWVLSWLLGAFAGLGMGYGWSIICLTLVVRGAMFPLSRKSQVSMRIHGKKMAIMKPKMDAIKAKYKDARKAQQKTMELMRKEKMSLLPGGCLIAFIQMPVWISLYGILQTTFEMRYEGFLWFPDLTDADHFHKLSFSLPFLGDWLNLLPIFMMITWGISARLQPLPEDPQQRSQAKMMRWMPMLFGLFLYKFAAGLCLYMTCSAIWSILEVNVIRKVWLSKIDEQFPTPAPAAAVAKD